MSCSSNLECVYNSRESVDESVRSGQPCQHGKPPLWVLPYIRLGCRGMDAKKGLCRPCPRCKLEPIALRMSKEKDHLQASGLVLALTVRLNKDW